MQFEVQGVEPKDLWEKQQTKDSLNQCVCELLGFALEEKACKKSSWFAFSLDLAESIKLVIVPTRDSVLFIHLFACAWEKRQNFALNSADVRVCVQGAKVIGGGQNRTDDLVHAKHALYQLSYTPFCFR